MCYSIYEYVPCKQLIDKLMNFKLMSLNPFASKVLCFSSLDNSRTVDTGWTDRWVYKKPSLVQCNAAVASCNRMAKSLEKLCCRVFLFIPDGTISDHIFLQENDKVSYKFNNYVPLAKKLITRPIMHVLRSELTGPNVKSKIFWNL